MSLTRDEILATPASELAVASAMMMGKNLTVPYEGAVSYVGMDGYTSAHAHVEVYWNPDVDPRQAREVADWVCAQWASLVPPTYPGHSAPYKCTDPKDAIDFTLDETRGTQNCHWAWTPEQLTRAALLAFVDAGGEI